MHQYAATMPRRERTIVWSLAFAGAMLFAIGITELVTILQLPAWAQVLVPGTSAVAAFEGLLGLYNDTGWQHRALRWVHGNALPDLSGRYEVVVTPTDGRDQAAPTTGHAEIKQTRTHLSVAMSFDGSRSRSTMAHVHTSLEAEHGIDYQYRSMAVAPTVQDRTDHPGTARLWLEPDRRLAGDYHTGPPRRGNGSLTLTPCR